MEASKGDKPAMKHTYLDQSIDDEPKVKVLIDADVVLELFINRRGFVEDFEKLLAEIETSPQVEMYVTNKCLKRSHPQLTHHQLLPPSRLTDSQSCQT